MTHGELVTAVLAFHGSLLAISLAAFYKYGDRLDATKSTRGHMTACLEKIKNQIRVRVASCLEPVFADFEVVTVSQILRLDGHPHELESSVRPEGSEKFHNALDTFVDERHDAIVDYRILKESLSAWESAVRVRSWVCLATVVWQVLCLALVTGDRKVDWGEYSQLNALCYRCGLNLWDHSFPGRNRSGVISTRPTATTSKKL